MAPFAARPNYSRMVLFGLAVALLTTGSHRAQAERQDAPPKTGTVEFLRYELTEHGKARMEAAQKTFELLFKPFRTGMGVRPEPERVYHWSRRWLDAELENRGEKAERIAAYEKHLSRMKELQQDVKAAQSAGRVLPTQESAVDYYRAEAGFWLIRAKID
jgi:hypothetical protein